MKPPAFQFYVKDWRSSPKVQAMTLQEKGIYIELMALAWDSDQPGTITMSLAAISRELRIYSATLRRFLSKYSESWQRQNGNLIQPKLHLQWVKYNEISEKRRQAASKSVASAKQVGGSAFASAFASASKRVEAGAQPPDERLNVESVKAQIEARRNGGNYARETAADKRRRVNQEALASVGGDVPEANDSRDGGRIRRGA